MKDRITVVERLYHEQDGVEGTESESGYTRRLETSDQPYARLRLLARTEWQPLIPRGNWLSKSGMLQVINHEGEQFNVVSSQEEVEEVSKHILEIAYVGNENGWLVPPKESFKGTPTNHDSLMVRCLEGEARYTVTVYPA